MAGILFPQPNQDADAANFSQWGDSDFILPHVSGGCVFGALDTSGTPTLPIDSGKVLIRKQDYDATQKDKVRRYGNRFVADMQGETITLTADSQNYIYVNPNFEHTGTVTPSFDVNTTGDPPSPESVLIGTADTSSGNTQQMNRKPDAEFGHIDSDSVESGSITLTDSITYADGTTSDGSPPGVHGTDGTSKQSTDGNTSIFTIPHGLGVDPDYVIVEAQSLDASADRVVTHDDTNITIEYAADPSQGNNNLIWEWAAVTGTEPLFNSIQHDHSGDDLGVDNPVGTLNVNELTLGSESSITDWGQVSESQSINSVTGNESVNWDEIILADAAGGDVTVTLPDPSEGERVEIKVTDATHDVTITTPSGQTIDGEPEHVLSQQYISRTIISDGTNYYVI